MAMKVASTLNFPLIDCFSKNQRLLNLSANFSKACPIQRGTPMPLFGLRMGLLHSRRWWRSSPRSTDHSPPMVDGFLVNGKCHDSNLMSIPLPLTDKPWTAVCGPLTRPSPTASDTYAPEADSLPNRSQIFPSRYSIPIFFQDARI